MPAVVGKDPQDEDVLDASLELSSQRVMRGVPAVGDVIDDRYRVAGVIGQGGMGVVLAARDEQLGREVAIKWIHAAYADMKRIRDRFSEEARAMARVRHRHVVSVYAFGVHERFPYLVMERVSGQTLEERITGRRGVAFDLESEVTALAQVCAGVHAIHVTGIAHGDIKASNVLLAAGGAMVTDFGLARTIGDETPKAFLGGTPAYLAPEVGQAASLRSMTHLVDVYALGVLAFEALTGRLPFPGESATAVLYKHANEAPPRPSEFDGRLAPFDAPILMALAKDPFARYETALEFGEALSMAQSKITVIPERAGSLLVVDPDRDFQTFVRAVANSRLPSVTVLFAESAEQALRILAKEPIEAIVSELVLPEANGLELLMDTRGLPSPPPFLFVTAQGGAKDWKVARKLGADAFSLKPISAVDLGDRLLQLFPRESLLP